MQDEELIIAGHGFTSRLFTGTGKFAAKNWIPRMLAASGSGMITVALRRIDGGGTNENILDFIPKDVVLLPNTSGARTAEEAVRIARIARAAGCGNFIKIEGCRRPTSISTRLSSVIAWPPGDRRTTPSSCPRSSATGAT
ncbi:MAG: hypothetical protein R6V78_12145, partial [Desulfosarcina sp.]